MLILKIDIFISGTILSLIGLGIITSVIFQWKLRQSVRKLPEGWEKPISMKHFQLGVFFLCLFVTGGFITEIVSEYLARQKIYNSFVFSIDFTVTTLFLFGFLFIHTQKSWKRYSYFLLYAIIVTYLIQGGYYDPDCVLSGDSSLVIFSIYFLAALLHLTDLLLVPKSIYFDFQLKINLTLLVYSLVSVILTSFYWAKTTTMDSTLSDFIFYIYALNIGLFYLSITAIFTHEILKLRRG